MGLAFGRAYSQVRWESAYTPVAQKGWVGS